MNNIHGDDAYKYPEININFSSNIYAHANIDALKEHLNAHLDCISSYPEPEPESLESIIATNEGISNENVIAGNGATEIIYMIAEMMRGKTYKVHNPTFAEYEIACRKHNMLAPYLADKHDIEWICNPNNPDGRVWEKNHLLSHVDNNADTLFVIDASYEDYTLQPLPTTTEILERKNVIAIHSMTKKHCIPGLRLGYAIGQKKAIQQLRKLRQPWSVNALAIEAGRFLLTQKPSILPPMHDYLSEANRLAQAINSIEGFTAEIKDTHFFLCTSPVPATEQKEHLALKHGILIRDASNFPTLSPYHFRIAAQNAEDNDALVKALSTNP